MLFNFLDFVGFIPLPKWMQPPFILTASMTCCQCSLDSPFFPLMVGEVKLLSGPTARAASCAITLRFPSSQAAFNQHDSVFLPEPM